MKKLLPILICLFVSFEVKSKDKAFKCDGIFESSILPSREQTKIYYLNERKKYLGRSDKKERKSDVEKEYLKLLKKNFEETDREFKFFITYNANTFKNVKRGVYKKFKSGKEYEVLPFGFYEKSISLNRYSGTIRESVSKYNVYPYFAKPKLVYDSIFIGNCKEVDRKF